MTPMMKEKWLNIWKIEELKKLINKPPQIEINKNKKRTINKIHNRLIKGQMNKVRHSILNKTFK